MKEFLNKHSIKIAMIISLIGAILIRYEDYRVDGLHNMFETTLSTIGSILFSSVFVYGLIILILNIKNKFNRK